MSKQTKKQKEQTLAEVEDMKEVMSSSQGRRVIWKLLTRAGIYNCSFTGQSNGTIFNEGGRNQGLMLLADVQIAAPGSYLTMMKECNNG